MKNQYSTMISFVNLAHSF